MTTDVPSNVPGAERTQNQGVNEDASRPTSSERPRRKRRSRRRTDRAEDLGRTLLIATVAFSAMALGALHWMALVPAAALSLAAGTVAMAAVPRRSLYVPVLVPLTLAAFTVLQLLPLPMAWLRVLSPAMAEVWTRARSLFLGMPNGWATISADPGATSIEALKWLTYAGVLAASIAAGARRGVRWGATVLFLSALVVGGTTFVHGLAGLHRVYGLYTPTFQPSRWRVGPLLNPNNLAGYLNLGLLAGMGLLLSRRPKIPRVVLGIGVASLIGVVVVCASRAGLVALLGGLVLFGLVARRIQRERGATTGFGSLKLLAPFGGVIVAALVLAWLGSTPETRHELFDKNIEKLDVMKHVAPLVLDHFWFGVGRGAFESVFPAYHIGDVNQLYAHPENFALQWVAEWGVPVGVGALLAFAWLLREAGRGARWSVTGAGMWAGFVALLLQNLLDLAFEVPGVTIAAFVALGTLWGEARQAESVATHDDARVADMGWFQGTGVLAVGVCLAGLAVLLGRNNDTKDRLRVHNVFIRTDFKNANEVTTIRGEIRTALLRHPADPYFPRLGAIVAWRTFQKPYPWIARSLERGMNSGVTHMELARILASSGVRKQAFLEMRLAVTYQPGLSLTSARMIVLLTRDYGEIERAAPEGAAGAMFLYFVAVHLQQNEFAALRMRCIEETIVRQPNSVQSRSLLAGDLCAAISSLDPLSRCGMERRASCVKLVNDQVVELIRLSPDTPAALSVKAQLLIALGKPWDAESLLHQGCARYTYATYAQCERQRVVAAGATGSKELLDTASKDLAAAGCGFGASCGELFAFLGAQAERLRDIGRALTYYQRAVSDEPTNAHWRAVARAAAAVGEHSLAASALGQLTRRNPEDEDLAQAHRAETWRSMDRVLHGR